MNEELIKETIRNVLYFSATMTCGVDINITFYENSIDVHVYKEKEEKA